MELIFGLNRPLITTPAAIADYYVATTGVDTK